jgi:protoheme IX farnesyltransferase
VLYGNAITAVAGFFLAAGYQEEFKPGLFAAAIIGTTLVIASACVINNYFDRDIDRLMERTRDRPTANGSVPGRNAVLFSVILGAAGFSVLAIWVNWLVVLIGAIGFVDYVWLYAMFSKRKSVHGTLVGSISGAMPVLAGYCAVSGRIDAGAVLVFLALFFWQMPEFYSISIYRRREYKKAGVPVMAVVKGVEHAKKEIFVYTLAFVVSSLLLTAFGYTGYVYFVVMAVLGFYWLRLSAKGFKAADSDRWARQMFHFSLIVLLAYSFMISVGALLP